MHVRDLTSGCDNKPAAHQSSMSASFPIAIEDVFATATPCPFLVFECTILDLQTPSMARISR